MNTSSPRARIRSRANRAGLIGFALTAMLAVLWAFASPIFSVPDENAHATKAIAQARGQVIGEEVEGVKHLVVQLPDEYRYDPKLVCFASNRDQSADCDAELGGDTGTDWFNTWVGAYNPVYYALVGWPSLFLGGEAGIIAMRVVSALIGALFLGVAFQLVLAGRRVAWMPLGVAFAATPVCLYLIGSVNPNGLEIAASVALWIAVLRLFEAHEPDAALRVAVFSRTYLWVVTAVAAVALVTARALGPLWLVTIVALAALAAGWAPVRRLFTTGRSYVWLAVIAAAGLFSLAWTYFGGSLSSQAQVGDAPLVGAGFLSGLAWMLRETPDFVQHSIGVFGWFDTFLPTPTYWAIVGTVAALLFLTVGSADRRALVVLTVVLGACIAVPALVQARSVSQTGIIWQGRYGLFLYLGALIVAAWILSSRHARRVAFLGPRFTWIGAALIAVYGAYAFLFVMYRYVVGLDDPISMMWRAPEWQPPGGWPLLVALYSLVSLGYFVFVGFLGREAAGVARHLDVEEARPPAGFAPDDEAEAEAGPQSVRDAAA